jgi:hypothetical protein
MTLASLKSIASLPVCAPVRRTALAAGTVAAVFSGGLPFVGHDIGIVMGRVAQLPAVIAFAAHLALAVLYGSLFSLVLCRSRDWWTLLSACAMTLTLYAANVVWWELPRGALAAEEVDALLAHLIFGVAFTVFFKLAEIGTTERA